MVIFQLLPAVVVRGLEQFVQWRYGPMGLLCFLLLVAGFRLRNGTTLALGAVVFMMLMAQA
ncbi:hypothetical protein AB0O76_31330 [Streptomyces sp. NPDC086554]|uniref:hypothetical protein n=1 Tax=Streptomyces sp. NPDC086554 TaxID=3154864 RepID=UPI00343E6BDB